ncbi:MAG: NAD(P)H-hydrate epimerase [Phycisphaerae bacterium]|nr:NAD(P)H-hydrate epimerase [Phycisphaerae bacterium]
MTRPKLAGALGISRRRPAPKLEREWVILDRAAARNIDRIAVDRFGIPTIVLMENAARHVADHAWRWAANRRIVAICGCGGNGGDGLAAARHLHNRGLAVGVVLSAPADRFAGDARVNLEIVRRMRLPLVVARAGSAARALDRLCERVESDARERGRPRAASMGSRAFRAPSDGRTLIIDAILGTGVDRGVTGVVAELIEAINARRRRLAARVVAVDLPSGMDCDTGRPAGSGSGPVVRANLTVTFAGLKKGFLVPGSGSYTGRVRVADIGVPRELLRGLAPIRRAAPPRSVIRTTRAENPLLRGDRWRFG